MPVTVQGTFGGGANGGKVEAFGPRSRAALPAENLLTPAQLIAARSK
jgi:hypothetical protein